MTGDALIICVSVHRGNTLAVARAMAEALRAEVREPEDVDPRTLAEYDVVGLGSGIYRGDVHPRLRGFVERMPRGAGARAFVFTTSGLGRSRHLPWRPPLEQLLRDRGYEVVDGLACPGQDAWFPLSLLGGGLNRGRPDAYDLSHAHEFAADVAARSGVAPA